MSGPCLVGLRAPSGPCPRHGPESPGPTVDLFTLQFPELVISEGGERSALGGVPQEQEMLKGRLPRVIYHQEYLSLRGPTPFSNAGLHGGLVNSRLKVSLKN